jgi:hypothetical protein
MCHLYVPNAKVQLRANEINASVASFHRSPVCCNASLGRVQANCPHREAEQTTRSRTIGASACATPSGGMASVKVVIVPTN